MYSNVREGHNIWQLRRQSSSHVLQLCDLRLLVIVSVSAVELQGTLGHINHCKTYSFRGRYMTCFHVCVLPHMYAVYITRRRSKAKAYRAYCSCVTYSNLWFKGLCAHVLIINASTFELRGALRQTTATCACLLKALYASTLCMESLSCKCTGGVVHAFNSLSGHGIQ